MASSGVEDMPAANRDEPADDDFLELDNPERQDRTFGRLGLLALGTGASIFVISFLLMSTVAKGSLLDLVVLVLWLGSACLALAGVGLLALACFKALMRKAPFDSPT